MNSNNAFNVSNYNHRAAVSAVFALLGFAASATAGIRPEGLPVTNGLCYHLDASAAGTVTVDASGYVTGWRSAEGALEAAGGGTLAFTNADAASAPQWDGTAFGGIGAVRFGATPGDLDTYRKTFLTSNGANAEKKTVFVVFQIDRHIDDHAYAFIFGKSGVNYGLRPYLGANATSGSRYTWGNYSQTYGPVNGNDFWVNGIRVSSAGTRTDSKIWPSGSASAARMAQPQIIVSAATSDRQTFTTAETLGDYHPTSTTADKYGVCGVIAEVVAYSGVLDDGQIAATSDWLREKWNIPPVTDGLYYRLDASAATSITTNADGYVTAWSSIGGTATSADGGAHAFTNASTATAPYYDATAFGGRGALRFGANKETPATHRQTWLDSNAADATVKTIFLQFQQVAGADDQSYCMVFGKTGSNYGLRYYLGKYDNTPAYRYRWVIYAPKYGPLQGNSLWIDGENVSTSSTALNTAVWPKDNPASAEAICRPQTVVSVATTTGTASTYYTKMNTTETVGDYYHDTSNKYSINGNFAEILTYPAILSEADIQATTVWLRKKWLGKYGDSDIDAEWYGRGATAEADETAGLILVTHSTAVDVAQGATLDIAELATPWTATVTKGGAGTLSVCATSGSISIDALAGTIKAAPNGTALAFDSLTLGDGVKFALDIDGILPPGAAVGTSVGVLTCSSLSGTVPPKIELEGMAGGTFRASLSQTVSDGVTTLTATLEPLQSATTIVFR